MIQVEGPGAASACVAVTNKRLAARSPFQFHVFHGSWLVFVTRAGSELRARTNWQVLRGDETNSNQLAVTPKNSAMDAEGAIGDQPIGVR